MSLGDYLLEAGRRSWIDGEHDCCTFPAGWVMLCGHPDPMAKWRGAYRAAEEAQALIEDAGGLVELWKEGLGAADVPLAQGDPLEGDVGVLAVLGEGGLTANGGIYTGRRWAFLAPRGLFCASIDPPHVLKVWRP